MTTARPPHGRLPNPLAPGRPTRAGQPREAVRTVPGTTGVHSVVVDTAQDKRARHGAGRD